MCPAEASQFQEHPRPPPAACLPSAELQSRLMKWRGCPGVTGWAVAPGSVPSGQGWKSTGAGDTAEKGQCTVGRSRAAPWPHRTSPGAKPGHVCGAILVLRATPRGSRYRSLVTFHGAHSRPTRQLGLSPVYRRRNQVMLWPEVSQRDQDWTPGVQSPTPFPLATGYPRGSPSGLEAQPVPA